MIVKDCKFLKWTCNVCKIKIPRICAENSKSRRIIPKNKSQFKACDYNYGAPSFKWHFRSVRSRQWELLFKDAGLCVAHIWRGECNWWCQSANPVDGDNKLRSDSVAPIRSSIYGTYQPICTQTANLLPSATQRRSELGCLRDQRRTVPISVNDEDDWETRIDYIHILYAFQKKRNSNNETY